MDNRPRLLDLFCGAGGAAKGYQDAGFYVVGVDIKPQPRYHGDEFIQADAIEMLLHDGFDWVISNFDAVHASPPCQFYSHMSNCRPRLADQYPNLIGPTRNLLDEINSISAGGVGGRGIPYVIENVPGARKWMQPDAITLCGHMFGRALYRHRLFEANFALLEPFHPRHVIPGGRAGHWREGEIISVSGHCAPIELAREVMEVSWTNRHELAESIPPYFMSECIGLQMQSEIIRLREQAA